MLSVQLGSVAEGAAFGRSACKREEIRCVSISPLTSGRAFPRRWTTRPGRGNERMDAISAMVVPPLGDVETPG
jgi:hypothetical protein